MQVDPDNGYAYCACPNVDEELPVQNLFSLRAYTKGGEDYLFEGTKEIGAFSKLHTSYTIWDVPVVKKTGADPGLVLDSATFLHPTAAGHIWINLHGLYSVCNLSTLNAAKW